MSVQIIKDRKGHIIGRLTVDGKGNKILQDEKDHVLGRYSATNNVTTDRNGRVVGKGDCLDRLL